LRAPENRVLKRLFGTKMEEVKGEWIKLHNVEVYICALHQILVIKSRRMRWLETCSNYGRNR
jgi:hypothetical protein